MRKIHLTTKDTKITKFREIIFQTCVSYVSSFENTCKAMVSHNEGVTWVRHTRESGYPG